MSQFRIIANTTSKLFTKDELYLDFTGYSDFLEKYQKHNMYDAETLSDIVREAILWNDYISEVTNTLNILLFSYVAEFEAQKANYAIKRDLDRTREKVAMLRMLKKELYLQKKHCMNIYYQTMKTYEKSMKAFTINDYVNS